MTEIIPIIKNVAIPPPTVRRGRRKYQFEQMEVGDMIFVPGRRNFASYVSAVGTKLGIKFKTRRLFMKRGKPCKAETAGAVFGTGVWRVG